MNSLPREPENSQNDGDRDSQVIPKVSEYKEPVAISVFADTKEVDNEFTIELSPKPKRTVDSTAATIRAMLERCSNSPIESVRNAAKNELELLDQKEKEAKKPR